MATSAVARPRELVREFLYLWEGRDKSGAWCAGKCAPAANRWWRLRCGGAASWRPKIKKQTLPRGVGSRARTWRCLPGSFPPCCVLACR